jgi:hypothetical protein
MHYLRHGGIQALARCMHGLGACILCISNNIGLLPYLMDCCKARSHTFAESQTKHHGCCADWVAVATNQQPIQQRHNNTASGTAYGLLAGLLAEPVLRTRAEGIMTSSIT